jgi:8-oxo-dGTP pyrophosphatase MutT (NUDIX family)
VPRDAEYAVLIPILERRGEDVVLLTLRRPDLPTHAGQVCLPGGGREPADADLRATALRETQEEVGIAPDCVEVVKELEWFQSGLGHRVKAFAGRVRAGIEPEANPDEVARLIYVPTRLIERDPFLIRGEFRDLQGSRRRVYTWDFEGVEIWGLTARILRGYFAGRDD